MAKASTLLRSLTKPRRNKYGARKTTYGDRVFDSAGEARRAAELSLLQRAGQIANLKFQPSYPLVVNGVHVCTIVPDFEYDDLRTGEHIVEDWKSKATKTAVFSIKSKLAKAVLGLEIKIVGK
jgi:hypothetical protein